MAQIGSVKVETPSGPIELPVYAIGDSGSNRIESLRVQTASGPGFIPLTDVSAADRPYIRVQTGAGVKAVDTSASGIPDSEVSRPQDDSSLTRSDTLGLQIESDDDWPEIAAELSANVSGATRAYIYRVSDGQLMDAVDISSLSAGQTFTLSPDLAANTAYNFVVDAEGASYTNGFYGSSSYPYTSSDGRLRIIGGALGQTGSAGSAHNLVRVGNIGLG